MGRVVNMPAVVSTSRALRPRPRPQSETRRRLLVLGTGHRALRLVRTLLGNGVGMVVACADRDPQPVLSRAMPDLVVLTAADDWPTFILEEGIDEIFVALPLRSCFDEWQRIEQLGRELGVPVHFDFDLTGAGASRLVRNFDTALLSCHEHPSRRRFAAGCKRALDLVLASAVLLITAPLLLLVAALVRLTSPGPVLFRQPRVGLHRREFDMLKFRTMVAEAESLRSAVQHQNGATGIMFKIARDPRVTKVGWWLRRTSVDELPQLFNVLRGEMSLVGPRPIPTWVFNMADEPSFHRRFSVMPGMTGLWQVNGREQHYSMMMRHDLEYVDRWSLWLDLTLLWRTIPVVLRGSGAR